MAQAPFPPNAPPYYLANIPVNPDILNVQPFTYFIGPVTLAAGASGIFSFTTFRDSDFLIISAQSSGAPGTELVQIVNGSTNWPLMPNPIPSSLVFGTGQLPYYYPTPWLMAGAQPLTMTITAAAGAPLAATFYAFSGHRIFRRGL